MRTLQRHVGNQAVTAMLERSRPAALQRKVPGPTAPQEIPADPEAHPEWPLFRDALAESLPASEIELVWALVLWGIDEQNPEARAGTFADAAERLRDLLRITPGRPMALWTGGFDVSHYAEQRGFSTLEHTSAGRVFDSLELYKDWSIIGALWNQLSRVFVEAAEGEVHVFMRAHDPTSVLLAEEIPGVKALEERDITIRWHALFGEALDDILEIDADGNLVDDASFADEAGARRALKRFVSAYVADPENRSTAADVMKLY